MQLEEHKGSADSWPMFESYYFPMLRGTSPEGVTWECPCGRVIAEGIYNRQMLDILVRCSDCKRVLQTPLREPGEPLAGVTYVEPGGPWPLGTIDIGDWPRSMVGQAALIASARETGRLVPGLYDPQLARTIKPEPEAFEWLASQLMDVLDVHSDRLMEADARGQRSRTPPRVRNHIVRLIRFLQATARALRNWDGQVPVDIDQELLADAILVEHLIERWHHHPSWALLRRSMVFETEHTLMMLAVASHLVDANFGVGVHEVPTTQNEHIADVWVELDLRERIDVEVKAPSALHTPKEALTDSSAERLLKKALRRSAPQRARTSTSLLIVGGYHLGSNLGIVRRAANDILTKDPQRWRGLAAIFVVDLTSEAAGHNTGKPGNFVPGALVEIVKHPGYEGAISLEYAPAEPSRIRGS